MSDPLRGSNRKWVYCAETVPGVTPTSPTTKYLRCLPSTSMKRATATLETKEVSNDRQKSLPRTGAVSASGQIDAELSPTTYDDFVCSALECDAGDWTTPITKTAATIAAASVDNSFNDSGSGFLTAGFAQGDIIIASGFSNAANNGIFIVSSAAAGKLIVAGLNALVTEAEGSSITIAKPKYMLPGSTMKTFTIAELLTDVIASGGCGFRSVGMAVDKWSVKVGTSGLVSSTFSLAGRDQYVTEQIVADTISAAATDDSFNDSASGFNFQPGDVVRVTGFTTGGNNSTFTVLTATAAKITVDGALTDEAEGDDVVITTAVPLPGSAASTTTQFAGISNANLANEGSVATAGLVTDFSVDMSNGLKTSYAIDSVGAASVGDDVFTLSGSISIFVKDLAMVKKFVNETASSLDVTLEEPSGKSLRFFIPYIRYTGADRKGDAGDMMADMPFQAGQSPVYGTTVVVISAG